MIRSTSLSLGNRLEEQGLLQRVGAVPTGWVIQHGPDLRERFSLRRHRAEEATLRRIITAATEITSIGYEEDEDVEESLDRAE